MYIQGKNGQMIAAGVATRDAETKFVGEKSTMLVKFSLAVGKDENDAPKYLNCTAWRSLAEYACHIKKLDNVAVMGVVSYYEYEKHGEPMRSEQFTCDWISIGGFKQDTTQLPSVPLNTPAFSEPMAAIDEDELPF